jgi:hypothetical protein
VHIGEGAQKLIGDMKPSAGSIVAGPNEENSREPVIRQVIGESTDRFPDFAGV